jgi:hypothetical protein
MISQGELFITREFQMETTTKITQTKVRRSKNDNNYFYFLAVIK